MSNKIDNLTKEQIIMLLERIANKCKYDPITDCVNWTGGTNQGYGSTSLSINGKKCFFRVTRIILSAKIGENLAGYNANHTCDNPLCIKPSHLYKGTPLENGEDAAKRNKMVSGERHYNSSLTEEMVLFIREPKNDYVTAVELAKQLGVSREAVKDVKLDVTWKHLL